MPIHSHTYPPEFSLGDLGDAKDAFQESLHVQRDCYEVGSLKSTPGFLATSTTISNLGIVAMAESDFELAILKLEDALKIQQNVLEATNDVVMNTIEILAYAYLRYGAIDKALEVSERMP